MSHYGGHHARSPPASGAATPTATATPAAPVPVSPSFLPGSFYSAFGGLMRHLSSDPDGHMSPADGRRALDRSPASSHNHPHHTQHPHGQFSNGTDGSFTPGHVRAVSPLRPPPLEPLVLRGFLDDTPASARLLSPAIAEEIRIMVPERLRIEDTWCLVYSLDQDGASLATLYEKCAAFTEHRSGFVLVVRDQEGATFGAYLSDYPHPSSHYFGTGECFLWRASLLSLLPPPPSADAATLGRSLPPSSPNFSPPSHDGVSDAPTGCASGTNSLRPSDPPHAPAMPASPSIRFSAFPYSGVNEYFIYCEPHSLSVGGGDGKYGLWLDDSLEKGVSATCLTFGNQALSDEGDKFGVLGVEVWVVGARGI